MKKIIAVLLLLPCIAFAEDFIESYEATVTDIIDGDTFKVERQNGTYDKIRLYGIDCPEDDQKSGDKATAFLESLIEVGDSVEVDVMDFDYYSRTVAIVTARGVNLNKALVENGYAWVYKKYCKEPYESEWLKLEAAAQNDKLGLWKEKDPTPPWDFRRGIDKSYKRFVPYFTIIGLAVLLLIIWQFFAKRKGMKERKKRF